MVSRVLLLMLLSSITSVVWAEGLYLQTLKNTQLTDEQVQETKKLLDEYKKITLRGELEVPPFHKRGKVDDSLGNSFCTTCHLTPPHTKSLRTRTFMNMHTQYVACETCHFRPEGVALSYQWQDTRDASLVIAQPDLFRQTVKPVKQIPGLLAKNVAPVKEARIINPFVKITPFYQGKSVGLRKNAAFAEETKNIWLQEGISPEKIQRRALIHAPLSEKGPKCQACHTDEDALLNLTELGASDYQANKIENNIVTQFFSRYKDEEQRIRIQSLLK
ncbi:multiheme c-type cytochrome [Methyloprofundus sp.]|uniref:multiheme c-type cytochrome n=1 Tax=Methyloprofundus sp. TaxID=2020875 RepID=UPI003D0A85F0